MTIRLLLASGIMATLLLLTIGCDKGPSSCGPADKPSPSHTAEHGDGHDYEAHEGHLQSYGDAVTQLVALRNKMRDAFAAKNDEEAHEPLHEVGHLLEDLPALAEKQTPPIDAKSVKETTDVLFDLFAKVDEKMHGAEGAVYADVADKIDAGVESLQKLIPSTVMGNSPVQAHEHE